MHNGKDVDVHQCDFLGTCKWFCKGGSKGTMFWWGKRQNKEWSRGQDQSGNQGPRRGGP